MKNQNLNTFNPEYPISKTRIYQIYQGMKQRCYNPNNDAFSHYGGRGISICPEWLGENGVQNFISWSLDNGYEENLTIDRKNNGGNYEPSNCHWVTQSYNASKGMTDFPFFEQKPLTSAGDVIRKVLLCKNITNKQLAEKLGVQQQSLSNKLYRGDMPAKDFAGILHALGCKLCIELISDDITIKI